MNNLRLKGILLGRKEQAQQLVKCDGIDARSLEESLQKVARHTAPIALIGLFSAEICRTIIELYEK